MEHVLYPTIPDHFTLPPRGAARLKRVIRFMKEAIPLSYIFCSNLTPYKTDLLLVTDKYTGKPFAEVHSILDLALLGLEHINCTVYDYGVLHNRLSRGHFYLSGVCRPQNCLYQRSRYFDLPLLAKESADELIHASTPLFWQNLRNAYTFYQGACQYYRDNEYNMTAFMLQQSCEMTYRGLLLAFRDKDVRSHELTILRKHVCHFIPEIQGVFANDEAKELHILSDIQESYIRSRYDRNYEVDASKLILWIEKTRQLLQRTHDIFDAYTNRIKTISHTPSACLRTITDETIF